MEKKLKQLIEGLFKTLDPSQDVLTESIQEKMVEQFIEAVTTAVDSEKESIDEAVAKQMSVVTVQIDEAKAKHATEITELKEEFEQILGVVDSQATELLETAITAFDARSVDELQKVKAAFDVYTENELEDLAESIETIIENKLAEGVDNEDISKLAKITKLEQAFESMKDILFKDAILDQRVNESIGDMKEDYDRLLSQNITMAKKLNNIEVTAFLESETDTMKPALKDYLVERFENAKLADIKENWDSAQDEYTEQVNEARRLSQKSIEDLDLDTKLDEDIDEEEINENTDPYAKYANQYANFMQ